MSGPRARWHRRAGTVVLAWALALAAAVLAHPFLPQPRWTLVHLLTLGVLVIVSYLVLHGAVLYALTAWAAARTPANAPPRPRRRAFIRTAAFLAEEVAVLAALTITEGQRASLVSGPWTLTDALWLPATGAVVLFLCYAPIARLGAITTDPPPPIRDALVAHTLALFVLALTGSLPL